MTTTMERAKPKTPDTHSRAQGRSQPKVRGRGWPVALIGIAAVILCAVAAWMWASHNEQERTVLVAATSLNAGHVLAESDLAEASVSAADLVLIDADQTARVVGQTLAVPLTTGTALAPSHLGPAESPAPGRAETTMAFAEGFYPTGIEPGQAVVVMAGPGGETATTTADSAAPAGGVWQMAAVVRAISDVDGGALVGLEFDAADRDGLSSARATELFLVSMTADASPETEAATKAGEGE